ncbi:enoyl-CoA hydratase-related protein [Halomarina halobia]|uniref:Enoyl-CoA hydratase-related protein n=1 Tax=Halomarina halobia TaxID=3033386 RepID=A0ABD6A7H6_9EURY|nr:enoyl-CoA hydratase-related protein [Halomarina sp. PSR21]
MSDEPVLLDVEDGIATLTLNRPDVRNAITHEVSTAMIDRLNEVERSDARALVVTGSGGSFSAGGDINAMTSRMSGEATLAESVRRIHLETSRAIERVAKFHLPTVAKIDGAAFGAGANLALACDVQVASPEAKISFGFRQVGLAVDTGTSYFLPRVVGLNKAKELVFTGELLDAEDALDLGLFNHVYEDFEAEADAFVRSIAEGPTVALETSKRALNQGLEQSLDQAMTREAAHQAAVFETWDHREGASAFMEKRDPEFAGE